MHLALWPLALSTLGLVLAGVAYAAVWTRPRPEEPVERIARAIRRGARVFMRQQYVVLGGFVLAVALVLVLAVGWRESVAFTGGALGSTAAGFCGMLAATTANSRTVMAARAGGVESALAVAFLGGSVMGLLVAAVGLLGLSVLYLGLVTGRLDLVSMSLFGLGASTVALFARVAGGIYTKSADMAADLAGKLEAGIPEDDARNPGVIADNVGDNVGDVAGMGADMFESYCNSMGAAILLAAVAGAGSVLAPSGTAELVALPLLLSSVGLAASVLGMGTILGLAGRCTAALAMMSGLVAAGAAYLALSWWAVRWLGLGPLPWVVTVTGTAGGIVIGLSTHYFTDGRPVERLAEAGRTGAATVILAGLTLGMRSMAIPLLALGATILVASHLGGLLGVALAAVGMLATVGIVMAIDAYGPIADNAGGLAQMGGLGEETRAATDALDELGNTTAAIGKGFAIGSAALTALALISAFVETIGKRYATFDLKLSDPFVLVGLLIGGLLPFLFSAMTMAAVGTTAESIVHEIRRQFAEIPGLLEGRGEPDSDRCTSLASRAALRAMIGPGVLAAATPLVVGFALGPGALGGMLGGALTSGLLLALLMANAGGAWDNAKKYVEKGNLGGKGSPVHNACIVGDTVGDPLKDTSGPALNILVKVLAITSLAIAPLL